MIASRGQQALKQWEGLILSQARFIASGRRPRPSASPSTPPQPAQQQQPQQDLPAVPQEQWTEVAHQQTGQVYYWNQRTGAQGKFKGAAASVAAVWRQPGRHTLSAACAAFTGQGIPGLPAAPWMLQPIQTVSWWHPLPRRNNSAGRAQARAGGQGAAAEARCTAGHIPGGLGGGGGGHWARVCFAWQSLLSLAACWQGAVVGVSLRLSREANLRCSLSSVIGL